MRDYGGDIPCPECGSKYHINARQLQTEQEISFTCRGCGTQVTVANHVAEEIARQLGSIQRGLEKIRR